MMVGIGTPGWPSVSTMWVRVANCRRYSRLRPGKLAISMKLGAAASMPLGWSGTTW